MLNFNVSSIFANIEVNFAYNNTFAVLLNTNE